MITVKDMLVIAKELEKAICADKKSREKQIADLIQRIRYEYGETLDVKFVVEGIKTWAD